MVCVSVCVLASFWEIIALPLPNCTKIKRKQSRPKPHPPNEKHLCFADSSYIESFITLKFKYTVMP